MKKKRRGAVTMTEVIVTVVIIGIIVLGVSGLFNSAVMTMISGEKEHDLQTSMKEASETIVNRVRYSTAVFIMPKTSFKQGNLSAGWSYFGIESVTADGVENTQIVDYRWVSDANRLEGGYHAKTIVVEARSDMIYGLKFYSADSTDTENTTINYDLNARQVGSAGAGRAYWELGSAVEALNSLQVVDYSTSLNQGVAIAYSTSIRDFSIDTGAAAGKVMMILDISGSMSEQFGVGSASRLDAMKTAAGQILDKFADSGVDIDVALIPFHTTANPTMFSDARGNKAHMFLNISSSIGMMKNAVEALNTDLRNMTNTGDAIRRAYHLLNNTVRAQALEDTLPVYVIVLVDGASNFFTRTTATATTYFLGDGNVGAEKAAPINGAYADIKITSEAEDYIELTSQKLLSLSGTSVASIRCFMIALATSSDSAVYLNGLDKIQSALKIAAKDRFRADDVSSLNLAFNVIGNQIIDDIWFVTGPSL